MWLFQRLLHPVVLNTRKEHKSLSQELQYYSWRILCVKKEADIHKYIPTSCILSVLNPGQDKSNSSLLSIKKQSSVSLRGTNPFPVYEDLAWFCVFDSDSWSEVCCAVSFLSHREHPETIIARWPRGATLGLRTDRQTGVPKALDREPWFMQSWFGYIRFLQGGWWRHWQEKKYL